MSIINLELVYIRNDRVKNLHQRTINKSFLPINAERLQFYQFNIYNFSFKLVLVVTLVSFEIAYHTTVKFA